MLAGVSTRKFARVGEPVGAEVEQVSSATGKTSVSELFVERTRTALGDLMARRLDDVRVAVMMLDGLEIAERTHVVALGISTEGVKIPLGLWEGSTENATVARHLLSDLIGRGLDVDQGVLVVLDGGKALRSAVDQVLGPVPVQRCVRHKECHEGCRPRPGAPSEKRLASERSAVGPAERARARNTSKRVVGLEGAGIAGHVSLRRGTVRSHDD